MLDKQFTFFNEKHFIFPLTKEPKRRGQRATYGSGASGCRTTTTFPAIWRGNIVIYLVYILDKEEGKRVGSVKHTDFRIAAEAANIYACVNVVTLQCMIYR